jgi:hypothetical protein
MMFRYCVCLHVLVILLTLDLAQYSNAYGLATAVIHTSSPKSELKSRVINSNLSNHNVITQSPKITTTSVPNEIGSIGNIVVGALIAALGLFIGNYFLDIKRNREKRPILQIGRKGNPYVLETDIELPIYDIGKSDPNLPSNLRQISRLVLRYRVNRIKVKNDGNSAAEDCKGLIIQDDIETKVCWNVEGERHKMTINAMSYEYLDLCALLEDDSKQLAETLKQNVSNLPETYKNSTNEAVEINDVRRLKYEFIEQYSNDKDKLELIKKHFPSLITPTENGWQDPPHRNRVIKPGSASVRITSKNANLSNIT